VGWRLLPWQRWLYIHALEKDEAGTGFRFKKIIVLVARQNGKTRWLLGLVLWKLYLDGAKTVVVTAQNVSTAEDTLEEGIECINAVPSLAKEVKSWNRTNGKKSLVLSGGRRWLTKASSGSASRSYTADLAIADELREHRSWDAWDALAPTVVARERGLIVAASNAGDEQSVVLRKLRDNARSHILGGDTGETRTGLFEWSVPEDADYLEPKWWGYANPSLGYTIDLGVLRDAAEDNEASFKTEHLCQWVDTVEPGVFPEGAWEADGDPESEPAPGAHVHVGVDVSFDRSKTYVALAYERRDGLYGVEVAAARAGTRWLVDWLTDDKRVWFDGRVALQTRGAPASSLVGDLREAGIEVEEWQGAELSVGCSKFYDVVSQGLLRHRMQPVLDQAATTAHIKPIGDAWVWDRKNSPVDCAPLAAATAAVWSLLKPKPDEFISAYEDGELTWV